MIQLYFIENFRVGSKSISLHLQYQYLLKAMDLNMDLNFEKLMLFSFCTIFTLFKYCIPNVMANRTMRVGYTLYPTWFDQCSLKKPITCPNPGASMETMWLLEKYYNAKFDYISSAGFGIGDSTETDSVSRGVINGTFQLGPTMMYES